MSNYVRLHFPAELRVEDIAALVGAAFGEPLFQAYGEKIRVKIPRRTPLEWIREHYGKETVWLWKGSGHLTLFRNGHNDRTGAPAQWIGLKANDRSDKERAWTILSRIAQATGGSVQYEEDVAGAVDFVPTLPRNEYGFLATGSRPSAVAPGEWNRWYDALDKELESLAVWHREHSELFPTDEEAG